MERDAEPADACAGQQQPHLRLLPEGPPHADKPEDARPQRQQAEVQLSSDVGGAGQARAWPFNLIPPVPIHPPTLPRVLRDVSEFCLFGVASRQPEHKDIGYHPRVHAPRSVRGTLTVRIFVRHCGVERTLLCICSSIG